MVQCGNLGGYCGSLSISTGRLFDLGRQGNGLCFSQADPKESAGKEGQLENSGVGTDETRIAAAIVNVADDGRMESGGGMIDLSGGRYSSLYRLCTIAGRYGWLGN